MRSGRVGVAAILERVGKGDRPTVLLLRRPVSDPRDSHSLEKLCIMRILGRGGLAHVLQTLTLESGEASIPWKRPDPEVEMGQRGTRSAWPLFAVAMSVMMILPVEALAQGGDGFLFKRPSVQLSIRGGYFIPRAGSEIFDFTRDQLTVDKSDFNTVGVGAEIAVRASERVGVALNFGYGRSETLAEFRDWVEVIGTDSLPILQTTEFTRVPVTANVKVYLTDRGRTVSRFAWIPSKVAPYVGGGVGIVWYEFVQDGEFVDFNNLDIFVDRISSSGTSATGHVFGGLDLSIGGIWVLTGEGRYSFGSVEMGEDFVGFDNIDLNGLQMTVGIGVRF